MKKNKWILSMVLVLTFSIVLAACQDEARPVDGTKKVSNLTAQEIYDRTLEATSKIKSAATTTNITQSIEDPSENNTIDLNTTIDSEITTDPTRMHQKGNIEMDLEGIPVEMNFEMYMTEKGMYMYDSQSEKWLDLSETLPEEQMNQQQDLEEQVKIVEQFTDDFDLQQEDDVFILRLTADGEKVQALSKELMEEYMPEELLAEMKKENENPLDDMQINDLYYEMKIDKDSFLLQSMHIDTDIRINGKEGNVNMQQQADTSYQNINAIDSIDIPQDVLDKAETLP